MKRSLHVCPRYGSCAVVACAKHLYISQQNEFPTELGLKNVSDMGSRGGNLQSCYSSLWLQKSPTDIPSITNAEWIQLWKPIYHHRSDFRDFSISLCTFMLIPTKPPQNIYGSPGRALWHTADGATLVIKNLWRYRGHYDVIVMWTQFTGNFVSLQISCLDLCINISVAEQAPRHCVG